MLGYLDTYHTIWTHVYTHFTATWSCRRQLGLIACCCILSEAFWIRVRCNGSRNDDTSENRLYCTRLSSIIISDLYLLPPRLSSPFSFILLPTEKRLDRDRLVSLSLCNSRLIENSSLISRPFHYGWHLHLWALSRSYLSRLLIGITLWVTSSGSGCRFDFAWFAEEKKHNGYNSLQCHDQNIRLWEKFRQTSWSKTDAETKGEIELTVVDVHK